MDDKYLKADANFWPYSGCIPEVYGHMQKYASNVTQYVGWVQPFMGEVLIRVFAYRETKKYGFEWAEVERKTIDCVVRRNMYFVGMGGGWHAVFRKTNVTSKSGYYGYNYEYFNTTMYNQWYREENPMGVGMYLLNMAAVFDIDKYKYCGYPGGFNLLEYLRLYEKYPEVEFFGKCGIYPTEKLIKKAKQDKQFIRFLKDNVKDVNCNGVNTVIFAYENKCSFKEAVEKLNHRRDAYSATRFASGHDVNRVKIYDWICEQGNVGFANYGDYFKAIVELGLDLNDTKNLFPQNFKRMHDLRIDEYNSLKLKKDEEKRKEFYKKFKNVADRYKGYEISDGNLCIVIPTSPAELINEGDKLHHCVGKMGYDKKMADQRCIIAFVRKAADLDTPFVTVEYLLDAHKVSQCYAKHDTKPEEYVRDFVNQWSKLITKQMKKARA